MSVAHRNVDAPGDDIGAWPYEAIVNLIERGTIGDWAQLGRIIAAHPWGSVARQVEDYAAYADERGVVDLLIRRVQRARVEREQAERGQVAALIGDYLAASGLGAEEFARAVGTSRSRLSTYRSGRVTPSAAMLLRMAEQVGRPIGGSRPH